MTKDLQIQSGFRSSWKTILNLFRSLYTHGRRKGTQKRYDQHDGICMHVYMALMPKLLCLQGKIIYRFPCQKKRKLRFLICLVFSYSGWGWWWSSWVQKRRPGWPNGGILVYRFLFLILSWLASEKLFDQNQIIARCAWLVGLELMSFF